MWKERDLMLRQQLDLQLFNREAERIDATTKGHEAFLDYSDLGVSRFPFHRLEPMKNREPVFDLFMKIKLSNLFL